MINGNKSLIGCFIGSFKVLSVELRYLFSNNSTAGFKAASLINSPIDNIFKAPIIDLTYLFISC